jgi:hypothetical protein
MRALPKTRYVTVAAETWGLIRGAYLSGLSAPTVAARFGVSVTALRKHAAREGWTKRAFAARQAAARSAPPSGPATGAPAPTAPDARPDEAAVLAAWRAPLHIRPDDLARRALAGAAHALLLQVAHDAGHDAVAHVLHPRVLGGVQHGHPARRRRQARRSGCQRHGLGLFW